MITASKVAGILGLSPYQSRGDVMRAAVRAALGAEREFVGNAMTRYGLDHELDAITDYERMQGLLTHGYQARFMHPDYPWLSATPDALVGDDGLAETKCPPPHARYTHVDQRPDYKVQILTQLECTQRAWGDLVVWKPGALSVSRVERDPLWLPSVLPALEEFQAELDATVADPMLAAPYLTPLVDQRNDEDWQAAAVTYLDAVTELDAAERAVQDARQAVLALAGGKPSRGAGVSVGVSQRRGRVDYKALVGTVAPAADLDAYRAESTTVYTIRTVRDQP